MSKSKIAFENFENKNRATPQPPVNQPSQRRISRRLPQTVPQSHSLLTSSREIHGDDPKEAKASHIQENVLPEKKLFLVNKFMIAAVSPRAIAQQNFASSAPAQAPSIELQDHHVRRMFRVRFSLKR